MEPSTQRSAPDPPAEAGPEEHTREPSSSDRTGWDRAAAAVLALMAALLVHGAWRVGPTYDEHFYIASGVAYLEDGNFALNREHPPLTKLLVGLPLLLTPGLDYPEHRRDLINYPASFFYQRNAAQLDQNLFLGRLPMVLLCLLLAACVWRVGRREFGPRAGFVGLTLFALNPNVLAHGRLAALDMGVTAFMFFAAVAFLELLRGFTWSAALRAAVLFGLANLAKFTSLVLGPFFVALAAVAAVRARSPRPLGSLALTLLGGLGVFALGYGFEAKSFNQAWAEREYVTRVRNPPVYDVRPEHMARAAREAGLEEFMVAGVRESASREQAVDRLGRVLAEGGPNGVAALAGLGALEPADARVRKRAFDRVLSPPEELSGVDPAARLRVLALLADVSLGNLPAWRAWYARNRDEDWDRVIFTQGWIEALTRGVFGDERPIPLFTAWKGIDYQLYHGGFGHGSYFRGRALMPGVDFTEQGNPHPEYYAWVMAVKNPLAFLVLGLLGLLLAFRGGPQRAGEPASRWGVLEWMTMALLPLMLFVMFSRGNALMGVRYVLPVYPFLCLLAGRVALWLPRAAPVLAVIALLESVWIHPDELMYYNAAAGGPSGGPAITVVGDDWGQGVRDLGRFAARHAAALEAAGGLYYEPYTTGDLAAFGLERTRPLTPRVRGILAVHEVLYRRDHARYAWLDPFEPFAVLAHSVRLYDTRVPAPGGKPLADWEAAVNAR